MKIAKSALASVAAAGFSLVAHAGSIGTIEKISAEDGSVLVTRGNSIQALKAGDSVFENDRIHTRQNGSVTIDAYGCEKSLGASSTVLVNGAFCAVSATEFVTATSASAASAASAKDDESGLAPLLIVGAAVAGAVIIAASSDDDDDVPVSP